MMKGQVRNKKMSNLNLLTPVNSNQESLVAIVSNDLKTTNCFEDA